MKRGLTKIVSCRRKTTRLATISRRTHGVMPNVRCGPIRCLIPRLRSPSSGPTGRCARTTPETRSPQPGRPAGGGWCASCPGAYWPPRSEEHTSELQSRLHLVCRLLLEKKKKNQQYKRKTCDNLKQDSLQFA